MGTPRLNESAGLFLLADRLDRIEVQLGRLLEESNVTSMWLTKKELARELGTGTRWIEDRDAEGLPHREIAGKNLYRLPVVEAWLRERSHLREIS